LTLFDNECQCMFVRAWQTREQNPSLEAEEGNVAPLAGYDLASSPQVMRDVFPPENQSNT